MRRTITSTLALSAVLIAAGGLSTAKAGTFDVKGVEITKGESELAFGAAWQRGFPVNSDFIRQSYEVGYSYGLTAWFKAGVKLGFEQPQGEDLDANSAGVEGQVLLIDPGKGRVGLAWYSGIDFGLKRDESEVATFGPLLSVKLADKLDLTLNPLFQRSWAPSTPGVDFSYAWQIKRGITDNVSLGLEGYGVVPDIGNSPSVEFQEHRAGPVVYLIGELGGAKANGNGGSMKLGGKDAAGGEPAEAGGPKVELQLGILFGFTDATADTTGRAKLAITW